MKGAVLLKYVIGIMWLATFYMLVSIHTELVSINRVANNIDSTTVWVSNNMVRR
jgi:hypothetical protein